MDNIKGIPGIYKLINKRTGEVYVGQSMNIELRCKQHFNELESGIHNNSDLQEDYNKGDKFSVEIIEEINVYDSTELKQELESREVYWIHKLRTYLAGYNKTPGGEYDRLLGDIDHSGGRLGGQYSSEVLNQDSWDLKYASKLERYYGSYKDNKNSFCDSWDEFKEFDDEKTDKEILIEKLHQITGDENLNESFLELLEYYNLDVFSARRIVDSIEYFIKSNDIDVNTNLNKLLMTYIKKEVVNK